MYLLLDLKKKQDINIDISYFYSEVESFISFSCLFYHQMFSRNKSPSREGQIPLRVYTRRNIHVYYIIPYLLTVRRERSNLSIIASGVNSIVRQKKLNYFGS